MNLNPPPYNPYFYPTFHQNFEPSAPPLEDFESPRPREFNPDLESKCCICLENLKNKPEGDTRTVTVLSKTDCHHFFHDLCIQDYLKKGMNQNCPLCRYDLRYSALTTINLSPPRENSPVTPTSDIPLKAVKLTLSILSSMQGLVFGGLKLAGETTIDILKATFHTITSPSAASTQNLESRVSKLNEQWKKIEENQRNAIIANQAELFLLLATANSLIISKHSQVKATVQRIERSLKVFEEKTKELQEELNKSLKEEVKKYFN